MARENELADWNRIATTYGERADSGGGMVYVNRYVWELLGDVANKDVLDVGCGSGNFCFELKAKGANVIGVDGSSGLLERARKQDSEIEFIQHDLADGLPEFAGSFDIVISQMTVMDIRDITLLFQDIPLKLKSGGRFIFTLLHPCFWNQKSNYDEGAGEWFKKVKGYLDHEVWRVESFGGHDHFHRSISYYFDALAKAGMAVTRLMEPAHEGQGTEIPEEFSNRFPLFLLIEATQKGIKTR